MHEQGINISNNHLSPLVPHPGRKDSTPKNCLILKRKIRTLSILNRMVRASWTRPLWKEEGEDTNPSFVKGISPERSLVISATWKQSAPNTSCQSSMSIMPIIFDYILLCAWCFCDWILIYVYVRPFGDVKGHTWGPHIKRVDHHWLR